MLNIIVDGIIAAALTVSGAACDAGTFIADTAVIAADTVCETTTDVCESVEDFVCGLFTKEYTMTIEYAVDENGLVVPLETKEIEVKPIEVDWPD